MDERRWDQIVAGIERALAATGVMSEEQLVAELQGRGLDLGEDPELTLDEALEDERLTLVLPLGDGLQASLPRLLDGRTFTHRVDQDEVERDFLRLSPDLEPVSMFTDAETFRHLVDGAAVVQALPGFDDDLLDERGIAPEQAGEGVWLLEPGTLRRLGLPAGEQGGLVGVTVRPSGFELSPVPASEATGSSDLAAGLAAAWAQTYGGQGADAEPQQLEDVVWLACAADPQLFTTPGPALLDVLSDAGLNWDGELVAPAGFDFDSWRAGKRIDYVAELHDIDEDAALATLALVTIHRQFDDLIAEARETLEDDGEIGDVLPQGPGPAPEHNADKPGETPALDDVLGTSLEFLAVPGVAEAVLVESIGAGREGAAALGMLAETLEDQAPRSAWPALRWLRGKALERLEDATGAEAAYESALSADVDWRPALLELARCASDRGDAERGLSLLRRAGVDDDDHLLAVLQRFRPAERTDIGRNDPCWCGSGRKYKKCHRGREQQPLAERAAWLYQKAGLYLAEGPWRGDVLAAAQVRSEHWDEPLATYTATQDPLVCDAVLFEGGAFAAFLAERGELLPDDERLLAEQWLLAERSVHEVEEVTPGSGFTARDLRTGDRLEVRERTASRGLQVGMLICARLVPAGETVQCFGGMEPVSLGERDRLIRLLDEHPDPELLVEFCSRRFAPPVLTNTEGEDLTLCEANLSSPDTAALVAALDKTYDRSEEAATDAPVAGDLQDGDQEYGEQERVWFEHVTTHGMQRIRATLTLTGDRLQVDTNSHARMDRVLATLADLQPGIEVVEESRRDPADIEADTDSGAQPHFLDPANHPEVAAALEELIRQQEAHWVDEHIPALAGATPREAAADPTRRPDLIKLLDSFGEARPGTMDPDRLRAELGL